MAGLFKKIGEVAKAAMHELVDIPRDQLSVPILEGKIRDLDQALEDFSFQKNTADAEVTGIEREVAETQGEIGAIMEDIELFLGDEDTTNDTFAERLVEKLTKREAKLARLSQELETEREDATVMRKTLSQLKAKREEMVEMLDELRELDARAKSKQKTSNALKAARGILQEDTPDIDNLASGIRRRADQADAVFSEAISNVDPDAEIDEARRKSAAQTRLAEIKANIAKKNKKGKKAKATA